MFMHAVRSDLLAVHLLVVGHHLDAELCKGVHMDQTYEKGGHQ